MIEILDSRTYEEALTVPEIPVKGRLEIRAANERRPALLLAGELKVSGQKQSRFEINGLLISGGPLRIAGEIDRVRLQHTTLVPGNAPSLIVESASAEVSVSRSILGALRTDPESRLEISDSIVDAADKIAYAALDGARRAGRSPSPAAR